VSRVFPVRPLSLQADTTLPRRLDTMRKEGGKEGRAKVAVAARRLMSLAKEVEGVEGAEAVSSRRALSILSLMS
jgi:hypothetical protein